jgi:site-specific recombinase XerC
LRADDLVGFVQQEAARLQRNLGRPPAVALRAMLRFLISEGQVPRGLEAAVPMPHQWTLASLPRHLNKEQVSQVLTVCQETKPNELRNVAVLLLLARLGLRAGEHRVASGRSNPLNGSRCTIDCHSSTSDYPGDQVRQVTAGPLARNGCRASAPLWRA